MLQNIDVTKLVTKGIVAIHEESEENLNALRYNIMYHGLLVPLTVYKNSNGTFTVIKGTKRLQIWKDLRLGDKIPCYVKEPLEEQANTSSTEKEGKDITPAQKCEYARFSASFCRTPLDHKVLQKAVEKLLTAGMSYEKIAQRLGCSKSYVQKIVKELRPKDSVALSMTREEKTLLRLMNLTNKVRALLIPDKEEDEIFSRMLEILEKRISPAVIPGMGKTQLPISETGKKGEI